MAKVTVVLCLIMLVCVGYARANEQVSVHLARIPPSSKTATAVIVVGFQSDDGNRLVDLRCISENSEAASQKELSGSQNHHSQTIFEFYLISGKYECQAKLTRSNGDHFFGNTGFTIN